MNNIKRIYGIVIICIGVFLIGGIIFYASYNYNKMPQYFTPERKALSEKLYNEIKSIDFENNYPDTPQKVIEINNKINYLFFSGSLLNDSLYEELLHAQMNLYSENIISSNNYDSLLEKLNEKVAELSKADVKYLEISQKDMIKDPNVPLGVIIGVAEFTNKLEPMYFNYYLERTKDDERFKITKWVKTNEKFE